MVAAVVGVVGDVVGVEVVADVEVVVGVEVVEVVEVDVVKSCGVNKTNVEMNELTCRQERK